MWKPETVQRKYNEKFSNLLSEYEQKLCETLNTNRQGIKIIIRELAIKEGARSGIATAYVMSNRSNEFDNIIEVNHPIFKR